MVDDVTNRVHQGNSLPYPMDTSVALPAENAHSSDAFATNDD